MKSEFRPFWMYAAAILLFFAGFESARAESQTITLQPGWNSIFIEVDPTDPAPAAVFGGVSGVQEVWSFFPKVTSIEFLSDPASGLWNVPGWNVWLAPSQTDAAALTNLFAITGPRAYLVKLGGTAPATLTVHGQGAQRAVKWKPDSFTLAGLPVDSSTTVRAGDWFASSSAHRDQRRFRLDPNGTWLPLADSSPLLRGQAYWIYTSGGSDFTAPLDVNTGGTEILDFGPTTESRQITVSNRSAFPVQTTLAGSGGFPLVYAEIDPATGNTAWRSLSTVEKQIPAGGSLSMRLGVRRSEITGTAVGTLTISGHGVALQLPLAAQNPTSGGAQLRAAAPRNGGSGGGAAGSTTNPDTGLWVGTATMSAVTEANAQDPSALTPAPAEFTLRLLIHVDESGAAKLLKEVILMRQRSSDPDSVPALVLVTDPTRVA
jgi:hypothetical protein